MEKTCFNQNLYYNFNPIPIGQPNQNPPDPPVSEANGTTREGLSVGTTW